MSFTGKNRPLKLNPGLDGPGFGQLKADEKSCYGTPAERYRNQ